MTYLLFILACFCTVPMYLGVICLHRRKNSLIEHIKRAHYQIRIWRLASIAISGIPKSMGRTCIINEKPVWGSSNKIMPASLLDIIDTVTSCDSTRYVMMVMLVVILAIKELFIWMKTLTINQISLTLTELYCFFSHILQFFSKDCLV